MPPDVPLPGTDHVLYWNEVLLDVFRGLPKEFSGPTRTSRTAAMVHGAVYDAANSARCATASGCVGQPYLTQVPVPAGTAPDPTSAIDHAAYRVLTGIYPSSQFPQFDFGAKLAQAQQNIPAQVTQQQRDQGAAIGTKVAQVMAVTRANDRSADTIVYTPGTRPGDWQPTGSELALTPHWGLVRPFTMDTPNQFRPSRPMGAQSPEELIASPTYLAHLQEVRNIGRRDAPLSVRDADKTEAAHFWANEVPGTYTPPGQHLAHTAIIADRLRETRGQNQFDNARLFALTALTLADAAIAAWDVKFRTDIDLWRPETAIHELLNDPAWQPESRLPDTGESFSPPFPAFISGHGTLAGAWAGVMKRYVGTDNFAWEATTDDPLVAENTTRSFGTFSDAAKEDALSRVWLGVHYRFDGEYAIATGDRIAGWVTGNFLGTSATLGLDSFGRSVTEGWGTAEAGGTWWVGGPPADFAVSTGAGRVTMPPAAGRSVYLNRIRSTGTDLTFKISPDKIATGNGIHVTAVGRKVEDAGTYRAMVVLQPGGTVLLQLRRGDATGAETSISAATQIAGLTYQAGSVLRVRTQVVGTSPTTVRAKVWANGAPEPDWQLTATDQTAALQGAGSAGMLAILSASATNGPVVLGIDDVAIFRLAG